MRGESLSTRLNQRITLLQMAHVDEHGRTKNEMQEFATVWAEIKPISSREFYNAAAIGHENDVTVTIRFRNIGACAQFRCGVELYRICTKPVADRTAGTVTFRATTDLDDKEEFGDGD